MSANKSGVNLGFMHKMKSCEGKQRFATFSEAARIAARSRRRRESSAQAYHCQHCGGFHWGNRNRDVTYKRPKQSGRFHWSGEIE